eukprot:SAG31_NODE_717_length_12611_cov_25.933104_8_plen_155_part_00
MSSARFFDRSSVSLSGEGKEGLLDLNLAKAGAKKPSWKQKYVVLKAGDKAELQWYKSEKDKGKGKAEDALPLHDTTKRPGTFPELGQFECKLPAVKEMHRDFSRAFSACASGSGDILTMGCAELKEPVRRGAAICWLHSSRHVHSLYVCAFAMC